MKRRWVPHVGGGLRQEKQSALLLLNVTGATLHCADAVMDTPQPAPGTMVPMETGSHMEASTRARFRLLY